MTDDGGHMQVLGKRANRLKLTVVTVMKAWVGHDEGRECFIQIFWAFAKMEQAYATVEYGGALLHCTSANTECTMAGVGRGLQTGMRRRATTQPDRQTDWVERTGCGADKGIR